MAIKTGRLVDGKEILLWIKPDGSLTWKLVACLQSNDFNGTTATTDSSSKCGDTSTPGQKSSSISFSGQTLFGQTTDDLDGDISDVDVMSTAELYSLWAENDNTQIYFDWFMGKAKDLEDPNDFSLEGRGYLSAFDWTNPNGDKSQFSGTITNSEIPTAIFATGSGG